jgi:hypothetical protein
MGCRHGDRENGGGYSRRLIDLGSEPMVRRRCSIAQLISGPARARLGPWTADSTVSLPPRRLWA